MLDYTYTNTKIAIIKSIIDWLLVHKQYKIGVLPHLIKCFSSLIYNIIFTYIHTHVFHRLLNFKIIIFLSLNFIEITN